MTLRSQIVFLSFLAALFAAAIDLSALEPPTTDQIERYRRDGTLAARIDAARTFGNHRMAPRLAARIAPTSSTKALPGAPTVLPSDGAPRVLTLLIAFEDMPGFTDRDAVDDRIFGDGEPAGFPYESLTEFYRRSSYGALEIRGSTLGWYTTPYRRDEVAETTIGRQNLIKEVVTFYDVQGHDFSQYDNDGDGVIDYLAVIWTGPHGEWAEFWWGYQTRFWNDSFTVDGVRIGTYSWQWENYNWPGEFTPEVLIHETGHALGLPDYYDYDDSIGPRGGCGGLDQMDGNWGDHNAFSKWILGWLEPEIFNQDLHEVVLSPTDEVPSAAVFMHGNPVSDPAAEYFIVQVRRQAGNDAELPNRGVLIWHVDARTGENGNWLYDNSYTEHKLLRLMEADGLEEIEQGGRADAGDFYTPGDLFDTATTPSSHRYDGVPTNLAISSIAHGWAGDDMALNADLGSGCALWCDASVTPNAWPGLPIVFNGSLDTANCDGSTSYGWIFGDGGTSAETSVSHAYVSTGSYDWSVTAELGDAVCRHQGSVLVCNRFPCWQWREIASMERPRSDHASVELADGRILVVGSDDDPPEIFDVSTQTWAPAAPTNASHIFVEAVALDDGRVLAVGTSSDDGPVSEIYDPTTDTWSVTGELNHDRIEHSAITLSDGRVLVVGGIVGEWPHFEPVESVEVFDPVSESWSVVGTLAGQRLVPGLVNLHDGRALIVGAREVTVFDPVSDTLARAAPLPDEWDRPMAVTLQDGRVLMADIADGGMTFIWNPSDGRWTIADDAHALRSGATATLLPNGLVLVAGGYGGGDAALRSTEFFDPIDRSWTLGSSLVHGRIEHTATLTRDGQLVLIGGVNNENSEGYNDTATVEVLTRPISPPRETGGRQSP
jgi:M6 family metalloprotease-like protein